MTGLTLCNVVQIDFWPTKRGTNIFLRHHQSVALGPYGLLFRSQRQCLPGGWGQAQKSWCPWVTGPIGSWVRRSKLVTTCELLQCFMHVCMQTGGPKRLDTAEYDTPSTHQPYCRQYELSHADQFLWHATVDWLQNQTWYWQMSPWWGDWRLTWTQRRIWCIISHILTPVTQLPTSCYAQPCLAFFFWPWFVTCVVTSLGIAAKTS